MLKVQNGNLMGKFYIPNLKHYTEKFYLSYHFKSYTNDHLIGNAFWSNFFANIIHTHYRKWKMTSSKNMIILHVVFNFKNKDNELLCH